jgi:hypothetical protein
MADHAGALHTAMMPLGGTVIAGVFAEICRGLLDGRNASLGNGTGQALGRQLRDFAEFCSAAGAGRAFGEAAWPQDTGRAVSAMEGGRSAKRPRSAWWKRTIVCAFAQTEQVKSKAGGDAVCPLRHPTASRGSRKDADDQSLL